MDLFLDSEVQNRKKRAKKVWTPQLDYTTIVKGKRLATNMAFE